MDAITEALRSATEDAPTTLGPDEAGWPHEAWQRGRRRRVARAARTAGGLLVAVLVVVALTALPVGAPRAAVPAGERGPGVAAYPQRVGHQLWVRPLPDAPGPMAGLVQVSFSGQEAAWQAIAPDGTRFALRTRASTSDTYPAISPDGRLLLVPGDPGEPSTVHDLTTGRRTTLPDVAGDQLGGDRATRTRYWLQGQSPAFFSPSGRHLAVLVGIGSPADRPTGGVVVVDTATGVARLVPGMQQAAGWRDDTHLVGRAVFGDTPQDPIAVVEHDTGTGRTSALFEARPPSDAATSMGQWWGQVDGDVLAMPWQTDAGTLVVAQRLPEGTSVPGVDGTMLAGAEASTVDLVGTRFVCRTPQALLVRPDATALAVADPSVDLGRLVWARDALAGDPTWTPLGTSRSWFAWWWGEVLTGGVALWLLVLRDRARWERGVRRRGAPG